MEEHIFDNIGYAEVAGSAHMSCYDFQRSFSFITGMTAKEYLRKRRLTLAAMELQNGELSVTEAAYRYGYESPESFSKAFLRFHGVTPKQARKKGAKLCLFPPLVIKMILEGGGVMDYRMEHRESQRFIALVRPFSNGIINDDEDHSIPDFWTECYAQNRIEPMKQLRTAGKRDLYGLCSPVRDSETHFRYGIGVLLDEETDAEEAERLCREGYSVWETEPADYAVFKCFGPDGDCLGEMWSRFYREFLPQTGYTQTEDTDYEFYFEQGESGMFCELWIPVKKG